MAFNEDNLRLQSAEIHKLQERLKEVQKQHDLLKDQLTPRAPPPADRSMGHERRPEIYYGRGDADENRRDLNSPPERDRHHAYGLDGDTRRDHYSPRGDSPHHRRPEMYYGARDRRGDTYIDPERPGERRPEMYRGDKSERDREAERNRKQLEYEEMKLRDRKLKYSYFDSTTFNPKDHESKDRGRNDAWNENTVGYITLSTLSKIFSRRHIELFFFSENRLRHFIQIVSNGENLYEASKSILQGEEIINLSSAELAKRAVVIYCTILSSDKTRASPKDLGGSIELPSRLLRLTFHFLCNLLINITKTRLFKYTENFTNENDNL